MAKNTITKLDWLNSVRKSPKKKRRIGSKEGNDQTTFAAFVKLMYPDVIFVSDISGMYLTIGQRVKVSAQRSEGKFLDMTFYEPRGKYHGLVIEMKADDESPFKVKDGKLKSDKRVIEQAKMMERLRKRGYKAEFAVGYNEAVRIFKEYINL